MSPLEAFLVSFGGSAVAALMWLLQSKRDVGPRNLSATFCLGGIGGCTLTMMGWRWFGGTEDGVYFLVAAPAFLHSVGISGKALADKLAPTIFKEFGRDGRIQSDSDLRRAAK